jgi:hypothetical protein
MQPSIHVSWLVTFAFCLGASATVLANMISFMMIGKINERLPENERISYFWWGNEVRKRFKQLYPGNGLVFLLDSSVVMMILCFILVVRFWVFG